MVRTLLPSITPPSYRGTTIRYLYYVRSTLSGQYIVLENEPSNGESIQDFFEMETRIPLQIWVTQKNNGLQSEEGIVPVSTILLDVYWKEMDADTDWAKMNEAFDEVEEGYESSRDEILSVSSFNHMKEDVNKTFGSSLSLQSFAARSSNRGSFYTEGWHSISSWHFLAYQWPRLCMIQLAIGGTFTFFHEEGPRRCLELSITLEMSETVSRRFVHPSRRHSPTITKVYSDHHEVVADLMQTSFLFSIPMDGVMTFSTRYVSVQWALRFEYLTTPKNVDWARYEHPLLTEGRDK